MTPTGTNMTSKSHQNDPKITKYPLNVGRNFGRVQILVVTPKLKQKIARVPPCVSYIFVTQKSGRVHILVSTPKLKTKRARVPPCVSYIVWTQKSGRVHITHIYQSSTLPRMPVQPVVPVLPVPPVASSLLTGGAGGRGEAFGYIYIYLFIFLREFVLTHVILAPGVCGR